MAAADAAADTAAQTRDLEPNPTDMVCRCEDVARAYPRELAENMCAVQEAAATHYGRLRAEDAPAATPNAEITYDHVWDALRRMARQAAAGLSHHDAACFLAHEAVRAAHRFAATGSPAVYDVHLVLLDEAGRFAQTLPRRCKFHACVERFADRPETDDPAPVCAALRRAAQAWPQES